MIKYVELTAPEASAFRQAKILSIECQEGQQIKDGDTLFRVQSGAHEINLPATKTGRIVEIIAALSENITLSTALLLLETEVEGSTASKPLDLDGGIDKTPSTTLDKEINGVARKDDEKNAPVLAPKKVNKKADPVAVNALQDTDKARLKQQKMIKKQHEQQALDLTANDIIESNDSAKQQDADNNEVVLTQTLAPIAAKIKNHSQPSLSMPAISIIEVTVPDIGADSAKVIEILVNVGDTVSTEDPLITLESDKASMDVPSPSAGVIRSISVSVDQDITQGTLILELEAEAKTSADSRNANTDQQHDQAPSGEQATNKGHQAPQAESSTASAEPVSQIVEVRIPDIGGDAANVIELLVAVGDQVEIEDPLVTLESDKASMDVPSSVAGVVQSILVSVDQEVSEGTLVVTVATEQAQQEVPLASKQAPAEQLKQAPAEELNTAQPKASEQSSSAPQSASQNIVPAVLGSTEKSHASPSIRRFAREIGVDLTNVIGSGRKGRITHDDVKGFVKSTLTKPPQAAKAVATGSGIPMVPAQDFSKFGEIDIQPLNKIKRLTAENLHRSWLNVPHVTHNDESNISDLESFRKQLNAEYQKQKRDIKLSPLAFIVKAVVNGLQLYPQFNSSLESGGENLIYKKYFNIGIAVETPNGLVVPVLKDADKKSVAEIAKEMGELAKKARDKKLTMKDMSGACITISSLGGIGGTGFTPIVNSPEVAILGVSRSKMQPVWNGSEFEPGMILPLSLSYDHRVIDGAEAARFTRHIAAVLEDVRLLAI
ncbi:MAG: pyruvate dehydrogenase E2 component (dihydrolipoamide acetyltransferase) [Arenicella sp.]|jgi:pyruvate dehydrogenase E2 component (dihydrolipoamide acetyltransferase)